MTSRKTKVAAAAHVNDMDALLSGIEVTVPEGLLAGNLLDVDSFPVEMSDYLEQDESLDDLHDDDGTEVAHVSDEEPDLIDMVTEQKPGGIDKTAFYEAQTSETGVAAEEDAVAVVSSKRKSRVAGTTSSTKAASAKERVPRINTSGMSKSETLTARGNLESLTEMGFEESDIPGLVSRIDEMPVKVQEKAFNLIRYMSGREQLSVYTKFVLARMIEHGSQTVPQIVEAMLARGTWKIGTARSQSQQVSRLLRAYDIIEDTKGPMTFNTGKPFVSKLVERVSA